MHIRRAIRIEVIQKASCSSVVLGIDGPLTRVKPGKRTRHFGLCVGCLANVHFFMIQVLVKGTLLFSLEAFLSLTVLRCETAAVHQSSRYPPDLMVREIHFIIIRLIGLKRYVPGLEVHASSPPTSFTSFEIQ